MLRHWVHFQGVHSLLDLLSWDPEELKAVPNQQVYHQDDQGQYIHLRTTQGKQMCGLIAYMKHMVLIFLMTHSITSHLINGPAQTYTNEDLLDSIPFLILLGLFQFLLGPYPHQDLQVILQQQ